MLQAIKSKRMSAMPDDQAPSEEGKDLTALVAALSDDEKAQLLALLTGEERSLEISKGDASTEEQGKVDQAIAREDANNASDDEPDSDDIAMSMIDRKDMLADPNKKPMNLGERARMQAASKLKQKGKL
jgi:hypothetical protein